MKLRIPLLQRKEFDRTSLYAQPDQFAAAKRAIREESWAA